MNGTQKVLNLVRETQQLKDRLSAGEIYLENKQLKSINQRLSHENTLLKRELKRERKELNRMKLHSAAGRRELWK